MAADVELNLPQLVGETWTTKVSRQQETLAWLDLCLPVEAEYLDLRPLMKRVDINGGPERMLELMENERLELEEEMTVANVRAVGHLNGNTAKIAGEASDILVFALATRYLVWDQMNVQQKDRFFKILTETRSLDMEFGIGLIGITAAMILNKNAKFNYRDWAFAEIPGETDMAAYTRYKDTVAGLKWMRKKNKEGILTDSILAGYGFDFERRFDPVYVHAFMKWMPQFGADLDYIRSHSQGDRAAADMDELFMRYEGKMPFNGDSVVAGEVVMAGGGSSGVIYAS